MFYIDFNVHMTLFYNDSGRTFYIEKRRILKGA